MCCIISLCPRIWKSRVLCLGVACGTLKIGFFGRFCGYSCAMLGSTVDTCSAPVLGAFGRILHIVYESDPEVFSLRTHAEWRSVLSRCFSSQSWYARSHLEKWKLLLRGSRCWQWGWWRVGLSDCAMHRPLWSGHTHIKSFPKQQQQIVDSVPSLPTLDDPAPQMVEQLPDILLHFFRALSRDPEQVVEVAKILAEDVSMRTAVRETPLAEQLGEVPSVEVFR